MPRAQPHRPSQAPEQPLLESLLPPGKAASAAQTVEQLGLWQRPTGNAARPRVLLNMVSSVDGSATRSGRSAGLSDNADRELFHALRAAVDGVLVGAGTAVAERYGRIIVTPEVRVQRRERGLADEPLACIVSGSLSLEPTIPLLAEPAARVALLTVSRSSLPAVPAQVEYVRCEHAGTLDLAACLAQLRARFGVELLLCEGGPHLARELLAAGLVDELFLSLAPLLTGGDEGAGSALRILAGAALEPPATLELRGVLRHDSTLFLRYAVFSGARVARETALSSSLAS